VGVFRTYICPHRRYQFKNTSLRKISRNTPRAVFLERISYIKWRNKSLPSRERSHFTSSNKEESKVANLPLNSFQFFHAILSPLPQLRWRLRQCHLSHMPRDEIKKVLAISNLWRPLFDCRPYCKHVTRVFHRALTASFLRRGATNDRSKSAGYSSWTGSNGRTEKLVPARSAKPRSSR